MAGLVIGTALVGLLVAAPAAQAVRQFSVSSGGAPPPVNVGENLTQDLTLTNVSDMGEPVSPNQLWLTASCGTNTSPCDTPDLGVFSLASVSGTAGVCMGDSYVVTADNTFDTGGFKSTPMTPRMLAPTESCTYHFVLNALRVPTNDSDPGTAGVQTRQRLYEKLDEVPGGSSSSALGDVTVNPCVTNCPVTLPPTPTPSPTPTTTPTTTPNVPTTQVTKKKCKKKHRRAVTAKKCKKK